MSPTTRTVLAGLVFAAALAGTAVSARADASIPNPSAVVAKRVAAEIPVRGAAWLFASALVGFVALANRRKL
ncbi:MAG: hypothetical protein M0037_11060 [Betaproteobacteria bacterium]|nr:hypothetical protein [Betaproteobacteria bacterium]